MRILLLSYILILASCGDKKTNKDDEKKSLILSKKLKNTTWAMPGYEAAGITIKDDKISISMSSTSFISNSDYKVLNEDKDLVVFFVRDDTNSSTFALSMEDPETIKISIITSSNDMEAYKEFHSVLGATMKRK